MSADYPRFNMRPLRVLALFVAQLTFGDDCLAQAPVEFSEIDVPGAAITGPVINATATIVSVPATLAATEVATTSERTDHAQQEPTDGFCFRGRPSPACRNFAVTDFGVFVGLTRAGWSSVFAETTARTGQIITDLGVMRNFGSHQAIGFTWFFSLRDEELSTGPAVRYRQWLNGRQSLDFGLGTMIAPLGEQYGDFRRGSVLGLIKYNPAPWFAVAIRSEVLRRTDCAMPESGYGCGPFPPGQEARARESGKQLRTASTSSILAGIELSEKPGATMSTIWLGAVGLITLLLAATGGS